MAVLLVNVLVKTRPSAQLVRDQITDTSFKVKQQMTSGALTAGIAGQDQGLEVPQTGTVEPEPEVLRAGTAEAETEMDCLVLVLVMELVQGLITSSAVRFLSVHL